MTGGALLTRILCRLGRHDWRDCGHPLSWAIIRRVCAGCGRHEHVRERDDGALVVLRRAEAGAR